MNKRIGSAQTGIVSASESRTALSQTVRHKLKRRTEKVILPQSKREKIRNANAQSISFPARPQPSLRCQTHAFLPMHTFVQIDRLELN